MSKNTYIFRRNSSYYIRIIVPSDLYSVFGAKHLRRSLHTHNYQEALDRAPKMSVSYTHLTLPTILRV